MRIRPRKQKRDVCNVKARPSSAAAVIERMQSAGVEFRWLPGGGLFVVGLSLCAPDLRDAFLNGDGGALHQAARALTSSGGI